ncbi:MAG: hypothetical protein CL816_04830 [Coxiellaceae bacterium]|nr:hypothetical protein [Coxiellaceae bacterium]
MFDDIFHTFVIRLRYLDMYLFFGAIMGFLSLALSAFIAHGLHLTLSIHQMHSLDTALNNLQGHAVLLVAMSAYTRLKGSLGSRLINIAAYLFVIGTLMFSMSIILTIVIAWQSLALFTPIGGMLLLLAWLLLIVGAFTELKVSS